MKHSLYALMAFCAFGLLSCKKNSDNFTIRQYDDNAIQTYISQNGITGMIHDPSDTAGLYYQVITQGKGAAIVNPNKVAIVYSVRSFDGKFINSDTIMNHGHSFPAYFSPVGLQLAISNLVKNKGGKIRVLVPSRLAYGTNGTTVSSLVPLATVTGGTTVTQTIAGNQGLDYTLTVINDDVVYNGATVNKTSAYDEASIKSYMSANGLSGYSRIDTGHYTGLYYKIVQVGTGTDPIGLNTTVYVNYTGTLFNGIIFDQYNTTDGTGTPIVLRDVIPAWQGAFPKVTAGAKLSLLSPSFLAYGIDAFSPPSGGFTLPAFSCLRFDINIITVTN